METSDAHLLSWLILSLSCTPGNQTFSKLIRRFETPEEILGSKPFLIAECIGTQIRDYTSFTERKEEIRAKAEEILAFCRRHHVGILPFDDPAFPEPLRKIENPPVLLYYRGTLPDFRVGFYAGIVGTRSMSSYGRDMTFSVAKDLATAGAVIVSGMALGIDGAAHAGAVAAGGTTVAVIGSGIDVCYPKQHLTLARNIVSHGCILTEYPPGSPPVRHHFPARNRLISGLSHAILVMEGGEKSGAFSTARYAMTQGKSLYALPGNINRPGSILPGILLRNGAKPFLRSDDIIRDFQTVIPGVLNPFRLEDRTTVGSAEKELEKFGAFSRSAAVIGEKEEEDLTVSVKKPKKTKKKKSKPEPESEPPQTALAGIPPAGSFTEEEIQVEKEKAALAKEVSLAKLNECGEFAADIYSRIPTAEPIAIEALVTEEIPIRVLMKTLLKMEIYSLVRMLPGERVQRA